MSDVYLPLTNISLPQLPVVTVPDATLINSFANSSIINCLGIPKIKIPTSISIAGVIAAIAGLLSIVIPQLPVPGLTAEILINVSCVPPITFGANFSTLSNPTQLLKQLQGVI